MKLTMLGTGHALVTKCYNTCFTLSEDKDILLVDAGGGNAIFQRLIDAHIDWRDIKNIYVTHKHVDHVLGIVWMIRLITHTMSHGEYDDSEVRVYAHKQLAEAIYTLCSMLLQPREVKLIGERLHLVEVADGQTKDVMGRKMTFFDTHSTKEKQFGFSMLLADGRKLTCCGDEPYNEFEKPYAQGSDWLLHEAFCLHAQADIYEPYEKNHSTALDAGRVAEELGVKNLLLYHTEDDTILERKKLYTAEAKQAFSGNVFVPDDLESIEL